MRYVGTLPFTTTMYPPPPGYFTILVLRKGGSTLRYIAIHELRLTTAAYMIAGIEQLRVIGEAIPQRMATIAL